MASKRHWPVKTTLVLTVILVLSYVFYAQHKSSPTLDTSIVTNSTTEPNEQKLDKNSYSWPGQPDDPKYITLPSIKAEGFIQKVGIDQNQAVAVPNNIHKAGWFVDSVKPGQPGLSIIDGHVDGRHQEGIFKHIVNLKAGDEYTVELGNGAVLRFEVKSITSVTAKNSVEILFSRDTALKSQLNLITCGGIFNRQTRQYDERVIIVSELTS